MASLSIHAPDGVPEVCAGDDLAGLLCVALDRERLGLAGCTLDDVLTLVGR